MGANGNWGSAVSPFPSRVIYPRWVSWCPRSWLGHDVRHDLPSGLQTCPSVKCTLMIAQIACWSLRSERSRALHIQVERLGCVLPGLSDSQKTHSAKTGSLLLSLAGGDAQAQGRTTFGYPMRQVSLPIELLCNNCAVREIFAAKPLSMRHYATAGCIAVTGESGDWRR